MQITGTCGHLFGARRHHRLEGAVFHQFGLASQPLGAHLGLEIDAVINQQVFVHGFINTSTSTGTSTLTRLSRSRCRGSRGGRRGGGWNASRFLIAHHGAQLGVAFLAFATFEFAPTHHWRITAAAEEKEERGGGGESGRRQRRRRRGGGGGEEEEGEV